MRGLTLMAALVSLGFAFPGVADAAVLVSDRTSVDLTDRESASESVRWGLSQQPLLGGRPEGLEVPDPALIDLTAEGLGWDGEPLSSRDGWIHIKPVAVAMRWRPPQRVRIQATLVSVVGESPKRYPGDAYIRYSSDRVRWSSWQLLRREETNDDNATGEQTIFGGTVAVPRVDRLRYDAQINDFQQQDVIWKSDETAAAEWIDERDPAFFDENTPFIGYIEVLFEVPFRGGRRYSQIDLSWGYAVGGIHHPPKDNSAYESENDAWSFRRDKREAKPSAAGE